MPLRVKRAPGWCEGDEAGIANTSRSRAGERSSLSRVRPLQRFEVALCGERKWYSDNPPSPCVGEALFMEVVDYEDD